MATNQTFNPWTWLLKKIKKDSGNIKTITWVAIFLFPNVEAGGAACVRGNGSNKYCKTPKSAMTVPEKKIPQVSLIKFLEVIDKLRASIKLNKVINHKSSLLNARSKLELQRRLNAPNVNKISSDNLIKLIFKLIFEFWHLNRREKNISIPEPKNA